MVEQLHDHTGRSANDIVQIFVDVDFGEDQRLVPRGADVLLQHLGLLARAPEHDARIRIWMWKNRHN